ncbi:MAG: transketolase [Phycisphaerales bacterium]|nr:transketolase [Phycisphaerales bacterium]
MSFEAAVHAQATELDRLAIEMTAAAGSGHPTTAMSLGHIVTVLMFGTMRHSPEVPDYPTADRLVLSEGHGVPIVYAAAAKLGIYVGRDPEARRPLTVDDLKTLREDGSVLDGHPNPMEGFPFFDTATGSLGQGLSHAAGLAEAARVDGLDRRIYCIIGDGESREGQIAEALDYIVDHKLTNVCTIFNCNAYGQTDKVSHQQDAETLAGKLQAYGYNVLTIDGHAPKAIKDAFDQFIKISTDASTKPIAIIAKTVKGWGSATMQGGGWHGKPATGHAMEQAIQELAEKRNELTSALSSADAFTIEPPPAYSPKDYAVGDMPSLADAMKARDMTSVYQTGRLSTRRAYGIALQQLGKINPHVVALDADVSNSTFACDFALDSSLKERFFECKIAEQNMFSVAAGLSAAGKIPFVSTFAKFITRAYDQIEMAINSGANLKIVGSHAGVSLAADGPSQMSLPDIAWFRSFATMRDHRGNPGCYVLQPADAFAAYALTGVMAEYEGACYLRTLRPDVEFLYSEEDVFNLGGFQTLSEGRDILLVASGYMVHEANKALDLLDKNGISASLVDLYSLPFDTDKLLDVANASGGRIVSIEDNYGGGFGSAVADALTESGDGFELVQMHVKRIPRSARTPNEVLEQVGLSSQHILETCLKVLEVGVGAV